MKYLPMFSLLLLGGQAVMASVHCTVVHTSLVKRMCEFDSCPSSGHAKAGQVVHAGCLADCSTETDPWVKLFDDTYIRATEETIQGCHSFSKTASIKELPRCHEETNRPKSTNCAHLAASRLSRLSKERLFPSPLKRSPPTNTTASIIARAAMQDNITLPQAPGSTTTPTTGTKTFISRRWFKRFATPGDAIPVPLPRGSVNSTGNVNGTSLAKPAPVIRRAAPNATFPNATETSNITARRIPRIPKRMPVVLNFNA